MDKPGHLGEAACAALLNGDLELYRQLVKRVGALSPEEKVKATNALIESIANAEYGITHSESPYRDDPALAQSYLKNIDWAKHNPPPPDGPMLGPALQAKINARVEALRRQNEDMPRKSYHQAKGSSGLAFACIFFTPLTSTFA